MQVKAIMTSNVEAVTPAQTLMEAAERMETRDAGFLPVCVNGGLVGIITDRDISVRAVAAGLDPKEAHVGDIMTTDIVYCAEDQDVKEAARLMEDRQVRRLPVLDRELHLTGIVSLGDLAVRTHNQKLAGQVLEQVSEPPFSHV